MELHLPFPTTIAVASQLDGREENCIQNDTTQLRQGCEGMSNNLFDKTIKLSVYSTIHQLDQPPATTCIRWRLPRKVHDRRQPQHQHRTTITM